MRSPASLRVFLLTVLVAWAPRAWAVKVQVRGNTQVDARAALKDGRIELRGSVRDDTGRPLGQARLRVSAARERGGPVLKLGRSLGCGTTAQNHIHPSAEELLVDTDGAGAFCLAFTTLERRAALQVAFEGDRFHDRGEVTLDVDSSRRSLLLAFSPAPVQLALERETHTVWLDARVEPNDEPIDEALQIRLLLKERDGSTRELGRTALRSGERAEVSFHSRDLGMPGLAELVAEFAGSDTVQPARRSATIQRNVRVVLSTAGKLGPADPSSGLSIDVAVGSSVGAVPSGAIEMVVGNDSVGTAPVHAGSSRVTALFPLPAAGVVPVTLRYLPEVPWWLATEPITVSVPVSPPSPWRRFPWVIAALAVGAWVVRSWWRPPRTEKPERDRLSLPPGRPSLEVIEAGPERSGWRGRVYDAHEATPVGGATLTVILPAFASDGVAARTTTDDEGRFELAPVNRVEGARLEVSAAWHSTLVKDLPLAGSLQISLVSRRRALLARLVEWAARMGKPWNTPGDATPRHVASVARSRRAEDVVVWAGEVEQAAFGPSPPDAEVEERVREQEPAWRAVDDPKR